MAYSFQANGNIAPSRFVKLDTTAAGKVLQAGAGETIFGISHHSSRRAPLNGWDDGYAAIAGETLKVWSELDDVCWLEIGVGGCTINDLLKSDANGAGVTTVAENDELGAVAMETVVQGSLCKVRVKCRQNV